MAITKKLVPLEGEEEKDRVVEVFDSSVPTRVIDERALKREKEGLVQQRENTDKRLAEIDADLAIVDAMEAKAKG